MKPSFSKNQLVVAGVVVMSLVALMIAVVMNSTNLTEATLASTAPTVAATDWRSIPFVNVRTKETMTLADFSGKTVVVQAVSIWCANCQVQHKESAKALTQLGEAAPVYISLDLDIAHPDDDAQSVANHEDYKQFPWIFAITNKTLTRALITEFGYNVLNAPITPIFVINPDGTASDLYTGNRSADEMLTMMQAEFKT